MTELAYLGITDIGQLYRRHALSPVELVRYLLQRIATFNPQCNAFLEVYAAEALHAAEQCSAEMMAGRWRGPMHGIPYALKDNIDVALRLTTCHSRVPGRKLPQGSAAVVRRLEAAGAILLGKASLHEFAVSEPTRDLPWPPALNPWNLAHHPGGSSSGCAVALAAGLVPAAIGTDTGGSVRNPATSCGLVGLKPTYGLVSREGVFPLAFSLDHVGPMTRNVQDNALLLAAIADPAQAQAAALGGENLERGPGMLRGLKIGVVDHFFAKDPEVEIDMVRAFEQALQVLNRLGATVRTATLPPLATWAACGRVIQQAEQYVVHERWLKGMPERYCESSRAKLIAGAFIPASDYLRMSQLRRVLCADFSKVMKHFDAVVTLSSFTTPCAIDDTAAVRRTYEKQARMPFNLTGTPAIAVPTGFSRAGLPLGMQIAGKAFSENTVMAIAHAYCEETAWHTHHPREVDGRLVAGATVPDLSGNAA